MFSPNRRRHVRLGLVLLLLLILLIYKWILNIKRNRLKIENLEKIFIVYFNSMNENKTTSKQLESEVDDVNVFASCSHQTDADMSD